MIDETGEEIYISFARYIPSFKYKARLSSPFCSAHISKGISGKNLHADDARSKFAHKETNVIKESIGIFLDSWARLEFIY